MTETTARNERRSRRRGGVETGSAPSRTGSYRRLVNPFTPLRVFSDVGSPGTELEFAL